MPSFVFICFSCWTQSQTDQHAPVIYLYPRKLSELSCWDTKETNTLYLFWHECSQTDGHKWSHTWIQICHEWHLKLENLNEHGDMRLSWEILFYTGLPDVRCSRVRQIPMALAPFQRVSDYLIRISMEFFGRWIYDWKKCKKGQDVPAFTPGNWKNLNDFSPQCISFPAGQLSTVIECFRSHLRSSCHFHRSTSIFQFTLWAPEPLRKTECHFSFCSYPFEV